MMSDQEKLWAAAACGDSLTIRTLAVEGNVDFDARDELKRTAFHLATQNNHLDTAKTILAAREFQYARKLAQAPAAIKVLKNKKQA